MADRTDAFVSYSHQDKMWLDRVNVHLRPLTRGHEIKIWQDTDLRGGQRWRQEISQALAKAKVAILLVSPDFLASDFIHTDELPPLLEAAQQEGLTILPVIVSACAFRYSPLSDFQAMNDPSKPLDLLSAAEVNRVLVGLFERVRELFAAPILPHVANKLSQEKPERVAPPVAVTPATAGATQAHSVPLALLVRAAGQWAALEVLTSSISNEVLTLTLQPDGPEERAFLTGLNQRVTLATVVYNKRTYSCKLRELSSSTEGGEAEKWKLVAAIGDLPVPQEITFNGISPTAQARTKAEAILLNKRPANDQGHSPFGGLFGVPENYQSPLFDLFTTLGRDSQQFQKVAPLVAAWHLQLQGVVTDIFKLSIQTDGVKMTVHFVGQRRSPYQNVPPETIEVSGETTIPNQSLSDAPPVLLQPTR